MSVNGLKYDLIVRTYNFVEKVMNYDIYIVLCVILMILVIIIIKLSTLLKCERNVIKIKNIKEKFCLVIMINFVFLILLMLLLNLDMMLI